MTDTASKPAPSNSSQDSPRQPVRLPKVPVEKLITPLRRFTEIESASGIVLLICAATALVLANSPLSKDFLNFWKTPINIEVGQFGIHSDLVHFVINDGLMALFFFVVGLEIKREVVAGELRDPKSALLPVLAALGGMLAPALLFLAFQHGTPGEPGWAVPMATDIAFVVGILALFGNRVPSSLKIMLLSLAIVDDLGAVLVIALVYTSKVSGMWLAVAGIGFGLILLLNLLGVRSVGVYTIIGCVIWLAVYKSGVHPTVAGVVLGMLTPTRPWLRQATLLSAVHAAEQRLQMDDVEDERDYPHLENLSVAAREAISPLHRLEHSLHPYVAFVIMPIFALANAGVVIDPTVMGELTTWAVALGLLLGKPLGIMLFCGTAIKFGIAKMPDGVNWTSLFGAACLAGIGFTMALFINGLAFGDGEDTTLQTAGKLGVLTGSLLSAIVGSALLLFAPKESAIPERTQTA